MRPPIAANSRGMANTTAVFTNVVMLSSHNSECLAVAAVPRDGRYDDADHGYRSEFGDKHEYREHYTDAYREGYQRNYSRRDYRESGRYYR